MSLQTRIAAFITAVGADIKSLQNGKSNKTDVWRINLLLSGTPKSLSSGTWLNFTGIGGFPSAGSISTAWTMVWDTEVIPPGTWAIDVVSVKTNNAGNCAFEYSLDDGSTWQTITSSVDLYASTNTGLVTTVTGVSVSSPTQVQFRARGLGTKNASSSAYYGVLCYVIFRRTA